MLLNETIVVLREQWGVSFPLVSQTSKDDTYANGGGKSDKCKINIALCISTLAPEWRVEWSAKITILVSNSTTLVYPKRLA